jgi:hypothetical protein
LSGAEVPGGIFCSAQAAFSKSAEQEGDRKEIADGVASGDSVSHLAQDGVGDVIIVFFIDAPVSVTGSLAAQVLRKVRERAPSPADG